MTKIHFQNFQPTSTLFLSHFTPFAHTHISLLSASCTPVPYLSARGHPHASLHCAHGGLFACGLPYASLHHCMWWSPCLFLLCGCLYLTPSHSKVGNQRGFWYFGFRIFIIRFSFGFRDIYFDFRLVWSYMFDLRGRDLRELSSHTYMWY